jgi:hypothetical protein
MTLADKTASSDAARPVLRVGCLAYYDSGTGVIPCRVLSIRGESGAPGSASSARIKTTAVRNGWPRGTEFDSGTQHVIPRRAFFPRRYGARIGYYTVEAPQP